MPRYKEANYAQGQFIPIQFEHQIMPGSFEHALSYVVDHKLDLTRFHALYHNDAGGAPAHHLLDSITPLRAITGGFRLH